jgi:hypothetical protein
MRKSICKFIEEIGNNVPSVPVQLIAINTAKVFFHRVLMVQSMKKQDARVSFRSVVLLAARVSIEKLLVSDKRMRLSLMFTLLFDLEFRDRDTQKFEITSQKSRAARQ